MLPITVIELSGCYIPEEILQYIISFLPKTTTLNTLSKVSKSFYAFTTSSTKFLTLKLEKAHLLKQPQLNIFLKDLEGLIPKLVHLKQLNIAKPEKIKFNIIEKIVGLLHLFTTIETLEICNFINTNTMKEIAKLTQLRKLNLSSPLRNETDIDEIFYVSNLTNLKICNLRLQISYIPKNLARRFTEVFPNKNIMIELFLDPEKITEEHILNLVPFAGTCVNITTFSISYSNRSGTAKRAVNDIVMNAISVLTSLRRLDIVQCPITNVGIQYILNLTNIRELNFSKCACINDETLSYMTVFTNLTTLNIRKRPIANNGIEHISILTNLTSLNIKGCFKILDIEKIQLLTNLRHLYIENIPILKSALQDIKKTIPNIEIHH